MIQISGDQLKQVEYLISQSIQGNHILFDAETIRRVLKHSASRPVQTPGAEHHLEQLILQPSLRAKRAYLERLDPDTFECVVRTYMNVVENNLLESSGVRH